MNKKILLIGLLFLITIFSGCVGENNSKTQTQVVTNGTATMDMSSDISLQAGEHIHYIEDCTLCNNKEKVGYKIAEFSETHNITKIKMDYAANKNLLGAYIIYKD